MPLYAFRCICCGHQFDRLLSLRDDQGAVRCPECQSAVRRLISTFATGTDRHAASAAPAGGG